MIYARYNIGVLIRLTIIPRRELYKEAFGAMRSHRKTERLLRFAFHPPKICSRCICVS